MRCELLAVSLPAHTTQFTEVGWTYLQHGAGVGFLEGGGSFVALVSPDKKDLTIIVETMVSLCVRCGWFLLWLSVVFCVCFGVFFCVFGGGRQWEVKHVHGCSVYGLLDLKQSINQSVVRPKISPLLSF